MDIKKDCSYYDEGSESCHVWADFKCDMCSSYEHKPKWTNIKLIPKNNIKSGGTWTTELEGSIHDTGSRKD